MQSLSLKDKRIAVVGIGGVGGFIAALLAAVCPHVTVCARGERGKSILEKGLILHSDLRGEVNSRPESVVTSTRNLPPQDIIFVCVKNYSLKETCHELNESGAVGPGTAVVPVMNGVDPADTCRSFLKGGTVIHSLFYIVAFANPDFSITPQGEPLMVKIGLKNPTADDKALLSGICALLNDATVNCEIGADIESEIWQKYLLNCAYNVVTAYYECPLGPIRDSPEKCAVMESAVREACAVAEALKIWLPANYGQSLIDRFKYQLRPDSSSSLERDFAARRPTELETFSGYLVRKAQSLGIPAPVSAMMYEALKVREAAF